MSRIVPLLMTLAVFVSGCALTPKQKAAIQRFSGATTSFADLASQEFAHSRADVIEMNKLRRQLDAASGFAKSTDDTSTLRLDGALTIERVQIRVDALTAISEYGQLLETLATSSNGAEMRAATDSFVASLQSVEGLGISDAKAQALGAIVEGIGTAIVESMRRTAVSEIVEFANSHVLELADIVEQSFDPTDEFWSLAYDKTVLGLLTSARAASTLAFDLPSQPVGDTTVSTAAATPPIPPPVPDPAAAAVMRASIQRALDLAVRNEQRFQEISGKIIEGCGRLRAAQSDLRLALSDETASLESMGVFIQKVREFVVLYKAVRGAEQ